MARFEHHGPRIRSANPIMVAALESFECGGTSTYEREVDDIVRRLHGGSFPFLDIRIAEDPADGALVGVCAIHSRELPDDPDAAYIAVIGIAKEFRGISDHHGSRIGDVLLEDALEQVRMSWGGGPMPPVWALVDPTNIRSHRLFERHHFAHVPMSGPYDVRVLEREMP